MADLERSAKFMKSIVLLFVCCAGVASAEPNQAIERALKDFPPGATDLVPRSERAPRGNLKTITNPIKPKPSFLDFAPPTTALSIDLSKAFKSKTKKTPNQSLQPNADAAPIADEALPPRG